MVDMTGGGHRLIREENFPNPADDEKGFDATDFVLLLKGQTNPDPAFPHVGCFAILAVFGGQASGGELGFTVRIVGTCLVCLVQKIRVQGIEGEPLISLDIVVSISRHRKGPHDEAE